MRGCLAGTTLVVFAGVAVVESVRCPAQEARAGPSCETIIRGVEARAEGLSFQGRVVTAWMYNPRFAARHSQFRPAPQYMASPARGFTGGAMELSLADLAYDGSGERWRYEERAVFLSGMPTGGWRAAGADGPRSPRGFYRYAVCDGETIRQYGRADGLLSVWPFGEPTDCLSWVEVPRWALLRTLWYNAPLSVSFSPDRAARVRCFGTEVRDAFECPVWGCTGPIEGGRSYTRVWVAPDLDFGTVRKEHVNVRADGAPMYGSVTRWTDWDVTKGVPLQAPRKVQMDFCEYAGSDADVVGPGWMFSRLLVADGIELSEQPLSPEALDVSLPFDTTVWDVPLQLTRQVDPISSDTPRLLALVEFLPPDPLLERIKTESPEEVLWGG